MDIFAALDATRPAHCDLLVDPASGLRAVLVLDDLTLGPAAGGIRTARYPSFAAQLSDALALARSMTVKCALAGLPAGGGKVVVLDHAGLSRPEAFAHLGKRIAELGGAFRTAGDLGTTDDDLRAARAHCEWVNVDEGDLGLAAAVGRTVVASAEAALGVPEGQGLAGVRAGVQGAGAIGSAAAAALRTAGAEVVLVDVDEERARAVAHQVGATVGDPASFFELDVDLCAPCARGGLLGEAEARELRARAVVGGANHVLAGPEVEDVLGSRGIVFVPDPLSSSGAVVVGVARTVVGQDPEPWLAAVGTTVREVLDEARREGRRASEVAEAKARARIDAAGRSGR